MTTRPPDHDPPIRTPLDAEEQAFARVLRAFPSAEPSAALDAGILRAAADAGADRTRRRPLAWLGTGGAGWGIGSAAAAVLALGIGWQAYYGDSRHREPLPAPMSRTAEAAAGDAAVVVDFKDHSSLAERAAASPPPPPPPVRKPVASPQRASLPRARPVPAPAAPAPAAAPSIQAFPDDGLDEHVADVAESDASAAAVAAATATEARSQRAEARVAQSAKAAAGNAAADARDVAAQSSAEGIVADRAGIGAAAPPQSLPVRPATWLSQVRALRDQGRTDEARTRLLAFRRAYPHWVIPTDLAPLLRE